VRWRETRRTSVSALRDDRDRKKSNFPSYLKKKEEVCRLKSVQKRGDGIKEGLLRGEGVGKRNEEEEKMSEPTFLKRKVDVLQQQRKKRKKLI
jgi:hypothetical protein